LQSLLRIEYRTFWNSIFILDDSNLVRHVLCHPLIGVFRRRYKEFFPFFCKKFS
jgi:hypothetical protein